MAKHRPPLALSQPAALLLGLAVLGKEWQQRFRVMRWFRDTQTGHVASAFLRHENLAKYAGYSPILQPTKRGRQIAKSRQLDVLAALFFAATDNSETESS